MNSTAPERRRLQSALRTELAAYQLSRLNAVLAAALPDNRFYANKFGGVKLPLGSLDDFYELPHTFKEELLSASPVPGYAANLTYPIHHYSRFHQTSGTNGRPMIVLDTADDWPWWLDAWGFVLDAAKISADDCAFFAFSFGPFIGFWSAFDAVVARGCLVVPGGGLSTRARLDLIERSNATAVFCTPSYALHMAEVARENQMDVGNLGVRVLVIAGEPGGSLPAVRKAIADAWHAEVLDHAGASEVGPWGYGDDLGEGLFVNEAHFLPEFISVESGEPARDGELAELVLTTLGRAGSPVFRYRTGDLVRPTWQREGETRFVFLPGGVLGRTDDMLVVRGVNVFPSSIEQIIRSFPEIVEYCVMVHREQTLDGLLVHVEDRLQNPARVADELRLRLGLKVEVQLVPLGSLPRFEGKGRRFIDKRFAEPPTNS